MTGGNDSLDAAADVFVSYSRDDEARAREVIAYLEAEGFSVWWDGMLEAGTVFTKSTETALDQAKAVVVLWSERSANSHWVRDEAQAGREDGRLVPVRIDATIPPLGFRQFQAVDLSNWHGDTNAPEICSVRDAVSRLVGNSEGHRDAIKPAIYRSPAEQVRKPPSVLILGGFAFLILAVAAFAWSMFPTEAELDSSSIAILEFDNLSDDPEQEFFSTGLSEELRQVLSQNSQLRVTAQTSTDEASKEADSLQEIGAALGVRFLLDGSVRRAGDVIRVSVQLVDNETGFDVWSETYERSLDDIFAVQTDISTQVARALELRVGDENSGELGSRLGGTENADAYEAYLRGKNLYDLALDEETDRAAQRFFETAVELDPTYGVAWAALARAQTVIANSYTSDLPRDEAYAEAIVSAQRGVDVSPNSPAAHAALGFAYFNGRLDARSAAAPYQRAFELGAGDADIQQLYATFAARTGRFDEAKRAIARAIELDPLNALHRRSSALVHYAAGEYDVAQEAVDAAFELNPGMRLLHRITGDIHYLRGNYREALESYDLESSGLGKFTGLAIARFRLGELTEAEAALAEMREQYGNNSLYQEAEIFAQWGETEQALSALESAYAANDSGLAYLRNDPFLDPIRGDQRFRSLLLRIGFEPASSEAAD